MASVDSLCSAAHNKICIDETNEALHEHKNLFESLGLPFRCLPGDLRAYFHGITSLEFVEGIGVAILGQNFLREAALCMYSKKVRSLSHSPVHAPRLGITWVLYIIVAFAAKFSLGA